MFGKDGAPFGVAPAPRRPGNEAKPMVRNLLGILLALLGAAAAAWSPFRVWYGGRLGRTFQLSDLFSSTGITGTQASLYAGLFLPMLAAAALTLIAALLRSRLLVMLAGLIVLGFTGLWMVRQGQDAGSLTAGGNGLGEGAGYAVGGGALLLLGALVMRGRHLRRRAHRRGGRVRAAENGHDTPDESSGREYSESPQPYGPFGTTHEPHGAYEAGPSDVSYGRYTGDLSFDDSTPPEEWDPWAAGRPSRPEPRQKPEEPPQGPQEQPPPPPGSPQTPTDTHRIPRRPDHRGSGPVQ
jgi:hypothetical protein